MTQAERFEAAGAALLASSGCTVRKWRSKNTGRAYTRDDDWGIDVPRPRGPVSFATFAHEIGHQRLHRYGSRARWLEEVEAWEFALGCFEGFELPGVERARADAAKHLRYVAQRTSKRCSEATWSALMARFPAWVWEGEE